MSCVDTYGLSVGGAVRTKTEVIFGDSHAIRQLEASFCDLSCLSFYLVAKVKHQKSMKWL
jgi:hypothetical protein